MTAIRGHTLRQHLRGIFGLAFALLVPHLPPRSHLSWVIIVAGVVGYIVARTLVLFEPQTFGRLKGEPAHLLLHVGEAVVVTSALVLIVVYVGAIVGLGFAAGFLIVIGYLLYHGAGLFLAERFLPARGAPKDGLRRFIMGASFLAEEGILLVSMVTTEHARAEMAAGPWGASDVATLPVFGVVFVLLCYLPVARISMAAGGDDRRQIVDAVVIHAAALIVLAWTGSIPL